MKGGISYMPRKQFTVKCSSSDNNWTRSVRIDMGTSLC